MNIGSSGPFDAVRSDHALTRVPPSASRPEPGSATEARLPESGVRPDAGRSDVRSVEALGNSERLRAQSLLESTAGRRRPELDNALGGRARQALSAYQATETAARRDALAQLIGIDVFV